MSTPLVLIDCATLNAATENTVFVPLISFPACTCDDVVAVLDEIPCPRHFPEERAVFGGAS